MLPWKRLIVLGFTAALAGQALAVPLSTISAYCAANKDQCAKGTTSLLAARGEGGNLMYMLEVDPTTGAIPVDATVTFGYDTGYGTPTSDTLRTAAMLGVGATAVSNINPVPVSDAGGSVTVDGAVSITQGGNTAAVTAGSRLSVDGSGVTQPVSGTVAATQSGTWTVQPGNTANTVPWLTTISQGGNAATVSAGGALKVDGSAATQPVSGTVTASQGGAPWTVTGTGTAGSPAAGVLTIQGITSMTPLLSAQSGTWTVAASNFPTTADTNYGTPGASTIRVAAMLGLSTGAVSSSNQVPIRQYGTASAEFAYLNYGSTSVTTGAWVQIIATTTFAMNSIQIFSGCGEVLELGTGGIGSETRRLLIPPGGPAENITLQIASSTRVSLRGVSGTCSTGYFTLSSQG